uniref:asparagine synthase (glutamine-hydrolyzing) n=1 Tax=viral metagenome TaxID=1070528 RepID=A0A6C0ERM1_9ZZZZ
MCGIFALLNKSNNSLSVINEQFIKGKNRGPEFSILVTDYFKMTLGFHRLAINGLNDKSNQPIVINNIVLICNGEIYNYKELYKMMNVIPETDSDCEVIIHLFVKYGIDQTLIMLDGVFSFILYDNRVAEDCNNKFYIARDPFGVRPLYCLKHNNDHYNLFTLYGFASELKCLSEFYNACSYHYSIEQFTPGTYSVFNISNKVNSIWEPLYENVSYIKPSFSYTFDLNDSLKENKFNEIYKNIAYYLNSAVNKRCLTTERPIACLLSGGLDSSLITALVNNFYKLNNYDIQLETYSIGLYGSEDLKNARIVADYLNTNHTEIIVTEEEMFLAIPQVIYAIESYDTTTVRASIGNYLLGKYISKNSEAKVIFNGDGSDELFGGYLYMNKCPDDIEFDKETRRLLKDIYLFDVLRSDKSISSNGLEPRTPFLDRSFVNYCLSIPAYYRNHKNINQCEKFLLRESFSHNNFQDYKGRQLLPDEILWRRKEAFSDGVSCKGRSLYTILQEQIVDNLNITESIVYDVNIDTEKYYYKKLFLNFYPNCQDILPYYWMPKYTNATDPSARTLDIYQNTLSSV